MMLEEVTTSYIHHVLAYTRAGSAPAAPPEYWGFQPVPLSPSFASSA